MKSLRQLYKANINRGGTHMDKLQFITEYVLIKFENLIIEEKIMQDMNLRQWAIEAKEKNG